MNQVFGNLLIVILYQGYYVAAWSVVSILLLHLCEVVQILWWF